MKTELRILAKMLFDLRSHRGRSEFRFRPRFELGRLSGFDVKAREGDFCAPVKLRANSSDLSVFTQVFLDNDYNLRRFSRYVEICRSFSDIDRGATPLILDCGANIGLSSLYFAKNWPSAHVVAVEPDPSNFELLRRNVAAHAHIQPVQAAVCAENGAVRIMNTDAQEWARRTERVSAEAPGAITGLSIQNLIRLAPAAAGCTNHFSSRLISKVRKRIFFHATGNGSRNFQFSLSNFMIGCYRDKAHHGPFWRQSLLWIEISCTSARIYFQLRTRPRSSLKTSHASGHA